jgi:ABC-type Fe3+ transport system substrate-binding protein
MGRTAKEMFKELGYKEKNKYNKYGSKSVVIGYVNRDEGVLFYSNEAYHYFHIKNKTRHTLSVVPLNLLNAIHQQMIELGWLKEEQQ